MWFESVSRLTNILLFMSGLNRVLVGEIWFVIGGIRVELFFGMPACVSSPIWCAICFFMLAISRSLVIMAFAILHLVMPADIWEPLQKCHSLGFVCPVFTDKISLHFMYWFVMHSFQFLTCDSCIDLLWVACTPCNSYRSIISASVWNSDTCWEWNVEFLAL